MPIGSTTCRTPWLVSITLCCVYTRKVYTQQYLCFKIDRVAWYSRASLDIMIEKFRTRRNKAFECKLDNSKTVENYKNSRLVGTREKCLDSMWSSLKKLVEWMFKFQWNWGIGIQSIYRNFSSVIQMQSIQIIPCAEK
jgi:hypothetical protein